jgi:trk system potassium uptake protein TrkH
MIVKNMLFKNANVYSKILIVIGALNFVPLFVLVFAEFRMRYLISFLLPAVILLTLGLFFAKKYPQKPTKVGEYETALQKGSVPVLFAWTIGIISGAVPFFIGGQLNLLHSFFESTSGWTGTGLSIVRDVEAMPYIFLFHRSFMQYCGGLGLIFMLILFSQGKQASLLFDAEGHSEKFTPSIKQTVRMIFAIYNIFLSLGILLYVLSGMEIFDAICHGMSALSTAGFSTKNAGIAYYDSTAIDLITIGLMLVGATSFAVHSLLGRFKFKQILQITEFRFMLFIIVVFTSVMSLNLWLNGYNNTIIDALFGVTSMFSTTGYGYINYYEMPAFSFMLMMLLMFIGGSVGSTSGGIKMLRVSLIFKITKESIRSKLTSPRRVLAVNYSKVGGRKDIDQKTISDTTGFIISYFSLIIIGTLLVIVTEDCTAKQAFYEMVSSFGNCGLSSGITNHATNYSTLIIEIFAMLLGRLEMFIVFIGIYTLITRRINRQ